VQALSFFMLSPSGQSTAKPTGSKVDEFYFCFDCSEEDGEAAAAASYSLKL
jgi:hypothetical protein